MACNIELALAALLSPARDESALAPLLVNIDWEQLIARASSEAVLPSLSAQITEPALGAYIPTEISDCLAAITERNTERNTQVLAELREIGAALNQAGIEPVVLKGLAYMLTGTYRDLGARYLSDLDLLIPVGQLETAAKVLDCVGYRWDRGDLIAPFRHHLPSLFQQGRMPVELHRSVGLGICNRLLPAEEIVAASCVVDWNGVRLRIPSADHLVTHLIIHSQLVDPYFARIWPPIRALYDLVLLKRRFEDEINWLAVAERFRSHGHYSTFALHLVQAEQTLAAARPISLDVDPLTRAKWKRQRLLQRYPRLRYLDPFFIWSSAVSRRSRLLRSTLRNGGLPKLP